MSNGLRAITDLLFVLLFTAVAAVVVGTDVLSGPVRALAGLSFVLFLPGYALVAAFYPEAVGEKGYGYNATRALSLLERAVFAVILSIASVALLALAVDYTPYDVARLPVLVAVVGWTVLFTLVAAIRRLRLPADQRFVLGVGDWLLTDRRFLRKHPSSLRSSPPFEPDSEEEVLLNVLVVVGVLVLAASVGFAAVADPADESFTELYLLSENDDGEMVAEGFETTFDGDESIPLVVAIGNHEGDAVEYTGVVMLQETDDDGAVQSREELDRFRTGVGDGESEDVELDLMPSMAGEDLRLTVLLYAGDAPDDPTTENAYRHVHLRITVQG